ncbi:IS1/IS1595 family N-terminal zinc-binding domain-containing protein [Magnetofaba australis]|uniref:IS1/IS1595 family N-terminal zinc-binding domain-containing protein n=1 Tax=Magnetofaba australis TaxID=1472297 RepID=UPI000A19D575
MAMIPVTCPSCGSENTVKYGKRPNGTLRFRCDNPECKRRYFQLTYAYKGNEEGMGEKILDMEKWPHYLDRSEASIKLSPPVTLLC